MRCPHFLDHIVSPPLQLQDNVSNLKILRRHSQLEENLRETENFALQNERDALTISLYKLKVQQMANKLKLEKARDDLSDVVRHVSMIEFDHSKKRHLTKMTYHVGCWPTWLMNVHRCILFADTERTGQDL